MTIFDGILNILLPDYPTQHIQSNLLHDSRFIPTAAPEEFTVIGSVGRASQSFGQAVNSSPMADSNYHYQSLEMLPCPSLKMIFDWSEKTLQFFWNFADCNHMLSPMISVFYYNSYRQERPFCLMFFTVIILEIGQFELIKSFKPCHIYRTNIDNPLNYNTI